MQVGDEFSISGADGSYVRVGPNDELSPNGLYIEVSENGQTSEGVILSSTETRLLVNALNYIYARV